jgi:hypothetical protein
MAIALASTACAVNPPPVPVSGQASDVSALAGEWSGQFRSEETGRSGIIYFKLQAGRDTAYGDVIMVPTYVSSMHDDPHVPESRAGHSQSLTIRFVRVNGSRISGRIEPYPSPDCECSLLTEFRGELRDGRILGTFTIQHSTSRHLEQRGTWWVERKPIP